MMRRGRIWLCALFCCLAGLAAAQDLDYRLKARQVAPHTWVIEGANDDFAKSNGCNIINTGFITTGQGVVVVNTGPSRLYGEQQRRLIARTTSEPVLAVLNLNLHPDYFFGNQAWAGVPIYALAGSQAGMQREGGAYADNLYRLCGDWMRGTESTPATHVLTPGSQRWGGRDFRLLRLHGHTSDDLVLLDPADKVAFAGGLVFAQRAPTTPHAQLPDWLSSLQALEAEVRALGITVVVPSHGPVDGGPAGFADTRDYLQWLDQVFRASALAGRDLPEVLRLPIPARFLSFAALQPEYARNVTHLYPLYEQRALAGTLRP